MGKKCRKLLALLTMFAMIVTYSFSASIVSVYADDEQGDVNAKAAASEESTPDPAPAAEPTTPSEPSTTDSGSTDADASNQDVNTSDDADVAVDPAEREVTDPELAEEEADVDEDAYPEVTLSKTVSGVTVTLHAPKGALPEGVKLSVKSVSSQAVFNAVGQKLEGEGKELIDAIAFDITPRKDGKAVQPRKPVTVTFSGTSISGDSIDVFRVSDDASSVTEMGVSVANSGRQQFSTNHFTIYVAGGSVTDPNGDGSNQANTQTHRLVLEHGQEVALDSSIRVPASIFTYEDWDVVAGSTYVDFDEDQPLVKNINPDSADRNVTIRHSYFINALNWGEEFYYITLKPEKVTVSFYLQDAGDSDFSPVPESEGGKCEVYKGQPATAPDYPTSKEYNGATYKFYGWYVDEECETDANLSVINSSINVYAKYTTDATILYKKNTTDAATVPDAQEGGVGTKVKLGGASRSGYTLVAWTTNADGSGESYKAGTSVTMPEGGMTLYAQWEESELNINYYLRNNDESLLISVSAPQNSRTQIIEDIPTRNNYIFLGWGPRNASPNDVEYFPGDTIETGESDINLYAVWGNTSAFNLLDLTADSKTVTYNGEEQTITSGTTSNGDTWDASDRFVYVGRAAIFPNGIYAYVGDFEASGTNAGTYATPVSAPLYYSIAPGVYVRIDSSFPFLDFPHIEIEGGMLTINPVDVTIETGSDTKEYGEEAVAGGTVSFVDGTETKTAEFTHEGGAVTLVNGETLNIRTPNSQTEIGSTANTYEVDWGKPDDWGDSPSTARAFNYNIIDGSIGTLTVTPKKATITFKLNGGTYNGSTDDVLVECYVGDEVTILQAPTREGYKFVEWQGSSYQPGDKYKVEGDHTFTAVWEPVTADDSDDESEEVDTGDNMNMAVLIVIMILSALSLFALVYRRRSA